ncbi:peptidyl-prolyl cis-trans isomerase FKBP8 [Belonocnema kinseyi]|uniref:peptidyl-prolyl cis-trans isomerase FKBP8 n=1 Tax=Belonocnema kinseyi TaxID=2817044 RepID=UPI00143D532C|nr:peptidyl-prolyl cis-trans isomerase FKBP8 [Belonocnema kinseyi]XP_033210523.1 peptidyl-prolyl cis-trans isomerase FKBP8 [Belonocnema kinseyi]XP_033210524.1 peptidyl-prolyl cis-trans isomerase FKBP8 [Belonocnema kinseyi]XP_033210525.1 peptidyl-prolyl cis-trans isomerase FKBP8 [Belonocnema kinseyi]XP_033210526.1 peptidyl-prolyl cis-trans isomerase FKBP8 [Belonocnema kinseyi]XP_033210527.1 peptidyl-prolyl cis-trans isomerase FKBP8 [Belonocnema kinseyi]
MAEDKIEPGNTQAEFIKNELNFDVDPEDPLTKASLEDHPENEWIDILGNGQLKKKVLKAGKANTRPSRGDICKAKITGKLENGTIVEQEEEVTFQLGDVEVVQGLDLAVALMDIGEEAEVEVASRFAYGTLGEKDKIPSGVTVWYTVELKDVEYEPEIESLAVNQRKEMGNKKRERGNWWIRRDEPTLAIQCYRRALDFLSPSKSGTLGEDAVQEPESDAEMQALLEDRLTVYNNLAAAQLKTQAYEAALKSVENVLGCQPQNIKALFRKGKILHLKGEHLKAYETLLHAQKLVPQNKAIQQELSVIKIKTVKDADKEKNLYRKMLGTKKENADAKGEEKKDRKIKTTTIAWSIIGGTIAAAVGVIAYKLIS